MNICAAHLIPQREPADRSPERTRARVREERLRATVGVEGSLSLSSWRGRSGRRYVVGIHGFTELGVEDLAGAVLIAVRRDTLGVARVIDVACGESARTARREEDWLEADWRDEDWLDADWLDAMKRRGAQEVHIHLLAADEAERSEIAQDLLDQDEQDLSLGGPD